MQKSRPKWLYPMFLLAMLIFSLSSVCIKYTSQALNRIAEEGYSLVGWLGQLFSDPKGAFSETGGTFLPLFLWFAATIVTLGIYSVLWQLLLEHLPLTSAYLGKGIYYIFVLIWSVLLFGDRITMWNILGSIVILTGLWLAATDKEEAS